MAKAKTNIWNEGDEWFFAAWVDGEYDDNSRLAGNVTEAEAVQIARDRFGDDSEIRVVEKTA